MINVTVKYGHYEPVAGYIVTESNGNHVCFYPDPWGGKGVTLRYLKEHDGTQDWESNLDDLTIEVGHDL